MLFLNPEAAGVLESRDVSAGFILGRDRFPPGFGLCYASRDREFAVRSGLPIVEITHTQADAGSTVIVEIPEVLAPDANPSGLGL